MERVSDLLQQEIGKAKQIQELLHQHPEAAYKEYFTTEQIIKTGEDCRA